MPFVVYFFVVASRRQFEYNTGLFRLLGLLLFISLGAGTIKERNPNEKREKSAGCPTSVLAVSQKRGQLPPVYEVL